MKIATPYQLPWLRKTERPAFAGSWSWRNFLSGSLTLMLIAVSGIGSSQAQDRNRSPLQLSAATLAIFPDPRGKPMEENRWLALVAAIHSQLSSDEPEIRAIADPQSLPKTQILRGDRLASGSPVANPIPVYLHGDCETAPTSHSSLSEHPERSEALGWVIQIHGQIEPFIHVDCQRIGQMLWIRGNFCGQDQRERLMAEAVSRVILHEWIHIATQNPGHSSHGLTKASFGTGDLAQPCLAPLTKPSRTAALEAKRLDPSTQSPLNK